MKKSTKRILAVCLCAAMVVGLLGYDRIRSARTSEKTYIAMGTTIHTSITGKDASAATDAIRERVDEVESACISRRIEDSDVQRINAGAGKFISVSMETAGWIGQSIDICEKSEGAFDLSIGALTQLWNFDGETNTVPKADAIAEAAKSVDYTSVFFNNSAVKIEKGQALDLGAVGKGIACDCAKDILDSCRIRHAVLSFGGSILVYGKQASVGIADPDKDTQYIGTLALKDQCVSTSGDYERFFMKDGKRYHHILDPSTGYPVENDLRSVTVVSDSGLDSDALSTACFVMGYHSSLGLLAQCGAQAVYIFNDHTVAVTDGLRDAFRLTDSAYTVRSE